MNPSPPQNDTTMPPYNTTADLPPKVTSPPPFIKPKPYYVPRGHPSHYGYRHGVIVVHTGPGGIEGVAEDWPPS